MPSIGNYFVVPIEYINYVFYFEMENVIIYLLESPSNNSHELSNTITTLLLFHFMALNYVTIFPIRLTNAVDG